MAFLRHLSSTMCRPLGVFLLAVVGFAGVAVQAADPVMFQLRHRTETAAGTGRYHTLIREEAWDPAKTAVIVCDVWDYHHCDNAVKRLTELATVEPFVPGYVSNRPRNKNEAAVFLRICEGPGRRPVWAY